MRMPSVVNPLGVMKPVWFISVRKYGLLFMSFFISGCSIFHLTKVGFLSRGL